MKTFIKTIAIALVAIVLGFNSANAQSKNEKTLEGVWVMQKVITDGQSKATEYGGSYTRIKVYGKNGEYCCAQVSKGTNGTIKIFPHEYGTYSYKNGKYTECGRACDDDAIVWTGENAFHGHWKNITEYWNRNTKFPAELENYVMTKCKNALSGDNDKKIQTFLQQYVLNK